MTVKEFVEKYNTFNNEESKQDLVKKAITRTYAPVMEKIVVLQNQFNKCILEENGIKYFDKFLGQINLVFAVMLLYTNIDCTHTEENNNTDTNNFDDYDLLIESGAYASILYYIGKQDIDELLHVYSSIEETFYNKQTTEAYIAKQLDRFATVFGIMTNNGLQKFTEIMKDDQKMNGMINKIIPIINNIKSQVDTSK